MSMLDYLDKQLPVTTIDQILAHLNYTPTVEKGDQRDNAHRGMLTRDSGFIALFHIIEHDALSHLSLVQAVSLLNHIRRAINDKRANKRKGAHIGIMGNVTQCIPVRRYHCKYSVSFHFVRSHKGIVQLEAEFEHKDNQDWAIMPNGTIHIKGE